MATSKSSRNGSGGKNLEQQKAYIESALKTGNLTAEKAKEYQSALERINKELAKQEVLLEASLTNMTEMSDSIKSLGVGIGKNNKLFEAMNTFGDNMELTLDSVSQMLKKDVLSGATKFKKEVFKTAEAYKSVGNVIAVNTKKLAKQQITTSQYNESVIDSFEDLEEQIDRVTASMESLSGEAKDAAKDTLEILNKSKAATESFAAAAERSKKQLEGMGFVLDKLNDTGIPAIGELGNVITKAAEGGKGLTLAIAALGFAAGKTAYDLGLIGDKLGTIASYDAKIAAVQNKIDIFNQKLALGLTGDGKGRNFIAEEAAIDFGLAITSARLEFEAASKTALFGKGLGSVGYGAAQLQMAGISAEKITAAMKEVSQLMGSNVSSKFGANVAILADRTGQSESSIASINDFFMRASNTSAEVALNMQEGMRAMAEQANINLGALMEDVAEASKNALSYQIKSGPALAKAAAFANSIGVKFTSIAEAGKNMVLNYKDSIKAEMSLSAMLGRRVDLSQVRALFAAGRTEDAVRALKGQGLNPANMNMFQQAQLQQALGGMDLNEIQKIATRTGKTVGLGKGNVAKENEVYISAKSSAESAKQIGMAVASAMAQLEKTQKVEGAKEIAKQLAITNNVDGIKNDMKELLKLQKEKEIASSGVGYGLLTAGLAVLLTRGKGLTSLLKGGGGNGLANMFSKSAATEGRFGRYIMSNKGKMINEFLPSGKVNPNFTMAKNLGTKPIQQYNLGRSIMSNKGMPINEFLPSGKINPRFTMAQNLGTKLPTGVAPTGVSPTGIAPTGGIPTSGFKGNFTSGIKGGFKGGAGILSLITAAYDYKQRKDAGQTTLQATAGSVAGGIGSIAMGAAGGALAGAAAGAAAGSVIPVVGTIIGGMLGYYLGSSLADNMTGANEPTVEAQEETSQTVEMSSAEIAQEIRNGNLLDPMEYSVELQQKMLEILGLQTEYLNDIAESNRDFTSVSLDGSKILNILNSRSNKAYGVTRVAAVNRNVK